MTDFYLIVNDYFSFIDGSHSSAETSIAVVDVKNIPSNFEGKQLILTVLNSNNPQTATAYEFMIATGRTGDFLNVIRGAFGTTPISLDGGEHIGGNITTQHFEEIKNAINSVENDKVDKVAGKGLSTEDYTTTEKDKLGGIAAGATANDTDANLRERANHTGTQTASTISDFDTEVANNADVSANTTHRAQTNNPHSVTKAQVGLGEVDNTSDINKPISIPGFEGWYSTGIAFERIATNKIRTVGNVDLTSTLSEGDKLELIFATSGIRYAFVTSIDLVSSKTEIELFAYEQVSLPSETINTVRASRAKNPWGFPLDEAGWSVTYNLPSDITREGSGWFNTEVTVTIPSGLWRTRASGQLSTSRDIIRAVSQVAWSTSTTGPSFSELHYRLAIYQGITLESGYYLSKDFEITSPVVLYLLLRGLDPTTTTVVFAASSIRQATFFRATIAYL